MPLVKSTRVRATELALCVLLLLAGCGEDAEPGGNRGPTADESPTATTTTPGASEGPALTADAVDAAVRKLIARRYPELLQVSDQGFRAAVDDPTIDRSRFRPALNEDLTYKCWRHSSGRGSTCLGWHDWPADPPQADLTCPNGPQLYYVRGVNHNVAKRTYDAKYRLTRRIQFSAVPEYFTATADGTGERTEGGYEAYFIDEYAAPGPIEADDAVTTTIVGRDAYQQTTDGELIWVNHGELLMRDPEPWGQSTDFDIVSGRWDLWEDLESATTRMCSVFD